MVEGLVAEFSARAWLDCMPMPIRKQCSAVSLEAVQATETAAIRVGPALPGANIMLNAVVEIFVAP